MKQLIMPSVVNPQLLVREFREKYGFTITTEQNKFNVQSQASLRIIFAKVHSTACQALHYSNDEREDRRLFDAHLSLEEHAELIQAMWACDHDKIADALADLVYVLYGIAEFYKIPMQQVLEEVHRSNMTKEFKNLSANRRDKGPNFVRPDIARAIMTGRIVDNLHCGNYFGLNLVPDMEGRTS